MQYKFLKLLLLTYLISANLLLSMQNPHRDEASNSERSEDENTVQQLNNNSFQKERNLNPMKYRVRSLTNLAAFVITSENNWLGFKDKLRSIPQELLELVTKNRELHFIIIKNLILPEELNVILKILDNDPIDNYDSKDEDLIKTLYHKIASRLPCICHAAIKQLYDIKSSQSVKEDNDFIRLYFLVSLHQLIKLIRQAGPVKFSQDAIDAIGKSPITKNLKSIIDDYKININNLSYNPEPVEPVTCNYGNDDNSTFADRYGFIAEPITITAHHAPSLLPFFIENGGYVNFGEEKHKLTVLLIILNKYPSLTECINFLLKNGASTQAYCQELRLAPLGWALHHQETYQEAADLIVNDYKKNPDKDPVIAFCSIANLEKKKCVKIILDLGLANHPLLPRAIFDDHSDIIKALIEIGTDINKPIKIYGSPLRAAFGRRNFKIFNILLRAGAVIDEDVADDLCFRALNLKNKFDFIETLNILEHNHCFRQILKKRGNMLRRQAIDEVFPDDLADHYYALLEHAQSKPSRAILEIAIEHDYARIVKLLIDSGIGINNNDLELAKSSESNTVIAVLKDHLNPKV